MKQLTFEQMQDLNGGSDIKTGVDWFCGGATVSGFVYGAITKAVIGGPVGWVVGGGCVVWGVGRLANWF